MMSCGISRYSKILSKRARAPWISICTLSICPSGKKIRLCSVVKATMVPMLTCVSPPMISVPARM